MPMAILGGVLKAVSCFSDSGSTKAAGKGQQKQRANKEAGQQKQRANKEGDSVETLPPFWIHQQTTSVGLVVFESDRCLSITLTIRANESHVDTPVDLVRKLSCCTVCKAVDACSKMV